MSQSLISPIGLPDTLRGGLWVPMNQAAEAVWHSSNDYSNHYELGFHTGVDLVLHLPGDWGAVAHKPIRAIADGTVIYARLFSPKVWGNLIILKSVLDDGTVVYSRYGHSEFLPDPSAKPLPTAPGIPIWLEGQQVKQGDTIAHVGNGASPANPGGLFPYHLHFDISLTTVLDGKAWDWPGENLSQLKINYTDPYAFIKARLDTALSPSNSSAASNSADSTKPLAQIEMVMANDTLNIRAQPDQTSTLLGRMPLGARFQIDRAQLTNNYVKLVPTDGWVLAANCVPAPVPQPGGQPTADSHG